MRLFRRPGHPSLGVGAKLSFVAGVLVLAVAGVATVGGIGLARTNAQTHRIYTDHLVTVGRTADFATALADVEVAGLRQIPAVEAATRARLDAELDSVLLPRATGLLGELHQQIGGDPGADETLAAIQTGIDQYLELRRSAFSGALRQDAAGPDVPARLADQIGVIFDYVTGLANQLRAVEAVEGAAAKKRADDTYSSTQLLLAVSVSASLLAGLVLVLLLIKNLVPRIRHYSQFASDLAAGRFTAPLQAGGTDELADLGVALNEMVAQRELQHEQERSQAEFVDSLQLTASEEEAHELVRRHIERDIAGSMAVVLQSDIPANRLRAATNLLPETDLAARLPGAEPRACLAVRFGRTHHEGPDRAPLLSCRLCSDSADSFTCEPLLVGGEVTGSVLVNYAGPGDPDKDNRIKTTVAQAAPALANARTMAQAEFRANNDSLTGLPNKRAADDTLKRMVDQANRSVAPLTAMVLGLDHFTDLNDEFGHGKGDEVLAAVGASITASLRASDFAGRLAGAEFLILLPETPIDSAEQVAEKIRRGIASIAVDGVERGVTASIGVAALLEPAGSAAGLMQQADRALYAAKVGGRNGTVVADKQDPSPSAVQFEASPALPG